MSIRYLVTLFLKVLYFQGGGPHGVWAKVSTPILMTRILGLLFMSQALWTLNRYLGDCEASQI